MVPGGTAAQKQVRPALLWITQVSLHVPMMTQQLWNASWMDCSLTRALSSGWHAGTSGDQLLVVLK